MAKMRAKMFISKIDKFSETAEAVHFYAVGPSSYPEDGSDENNTYAKFSPGAELNITICNPALLGQFKVGDMFYVDFTEAPK